MEKPLAQQIEELKKAIAAQDSIRAVVGDAIADSTLGALRDQLALLEGLAVTPESSRDRRKVVTVMFAVISNFAQLSEKIDIEDLMQLTNHVWQKLDRIILAQGGHIDKHQGDGVMALWGVELAREDDAEQAVRAGLKMLETIQEVQGQHALDLHIAIHSGTVLLGEVGVQREYTAMGNTVNMASHLKDVTPVGCIYISAETNRLIRGLFEVEKLPALQLKGIQEAVQAYRVLCAYPHTFRPHTRGVEGIKTRMVGREAELLHLQNELNQTLEKGRTRFTIVVGDAGLGKSRLLYEFEKWIEVQPQPLTVIKGRATERSMLTPYSLLRACLNNWIGVDESDPLAEMRAWLEQGVIDLFGGDESAAEKAHLIGQLAGIDFSNSPHVRGILSDPRQIRDRAHYYLAQILRNETKKRAALFLLEDLHWADSDSLALINELFKDSPDLPLYVVAVTRPTLFERAKWDLDHPAYDLLELKPLTDEGCHALVHEILQKSERIPPALEELVIQGAAGNPFYVEELIKMLIEEGAIVTGEHWHVDESRLDKTRIPSTLTGILQARLDSLPPAERLILQCASVLGKIFWSEAAAFIRGDKGPGADEALKSLQARELIFARESSSFAGIPEFTFKHAILRDVTYESVLKRDRRIYHRRAAEWLAEHAGEYAESLAALVAEHFENAEAFAPAAEWNALAGKSAAEAYAGEAAITYYKKALRFAADAKLSPEPTFDWYEALGKAFFVCGRYDDATRTYQEMLESAKAANAKGAQAKAWYNISFMQDYAGDIHASLDGAEKSEALARKAQDQTTLVNALIGQGWCYYRLGENSMARKIAQEALTMAQTLPEGADSLREQAQSYQLLGAAQEALGQIQASQENEERALQVFHDLHDRRNEAVMLNNQGVGAFWRGDYEAALKAYEESLEIARSIGLRDREGIFLSNLAGAQVGVGRFAEAEASLRQAIAIVGGQVVHYLPHTYIFLAEALRGQGRLAESVEAAQKACQIAKEAEQLETFSTALRTMGDCLAVFGNDVDRIRACYRESERLAAEIHADADRARTLRAWAKFEHTRGNLAEAQSMLGQAKSTFERLGMDREAQKCLFGDTKSDTA